MRRLLAAAANRFPAWVHAASLLARWHPPLFTWFSGPWIVWGLAVVMLGMGLTLNVQDFAAVTRMPRAVGLGFAAQYTVMPLLGWAVAKWLALPTDFAVGLILVACCPGGTASNVVTYLARANVALSVVMTTCSTLAAVLLTCPSMPPECSSPPPKSCSRRCCSDCSCMTKRRKSPDSSCPPDRSFRSCSSA